MHINCDLLEVTHASELIFDLTETLRGVTGRRHIFKLFSIKLFLFSLTWRNCLSFWFTKLTTESLLIRCNIFFNCMTQKGLYHLQKLQNKRVCLVYPVRKSTHVTPLLRDLQWLSIEKHIIFKTLFVCV